MMKRYDIERICLGFLIGGLFIGLLYIIFPEQRPCSLKPSQEHTQIMEKLDSIESRLP